MKPTCRPVSRLVMAVGRGSNRCCLTPTRRLPNVQSPNVSGSLPAWEPAATCVSLEEMIAVTACPDRAALARCHCATVRRSSGGLGEFNKWKKVCGFFFVFFVYLCSHATCYRESDWTAARVAGKRVGSGVYLVSRCLVTRQKTFQVIFLFDSFFPLSWAIAKGSVFFNQFLFSRRSTRVDFGILRPPADWFERSDSSVQLSWK